MRLFRASISQPSGQNQMRETVKQKHQQPLLCPRRMTSIRRMAHLALRKREGMKGRDRERELNRERGLVLIFLECILAKQEV